MTKRFYHNSHIPNELLFRDKERLKLLKFLLNGINTFIYGNVGSGKTTLLKSIIEEFNSVNNAKVIYVDATLHQTTNSILREVLSSISPLSAISKSNSYLINRLKEKLRNRRVIVCVDHFEHVTQADIVDKLLSLGINIVLVSDSKESFEKISDIAKSKITNILQIPKYDFKQVREILLERGETRVKT